MFKEQVARPYACNRGLPVGLAVQNLAGPVAHPAICWTTIMMQQGASRGKGDGTEVPIVPTPALWAGFRAPSYRSCAAGWAS